jgi:uncharacterized protein
MIHLTEADYLVMPWANGRGQTVEMIRQNDINGAILYRLSLATVAEDGPFSVFPGLNRNLTVIEGPGFDLIGEQVQRADPMRPVAFAGDIPLAATRVTAPSRDFNVMADRTLRITVNVGTMPDTPPVPDALHFYFALGATKVGNVSLARYDLLYGRDTLYTNGGPVLCVRLDPVVRSGTTAAQDAATAG